VSDADKETFPPDEEAEQEAAAEAFAEAAAEEPALDAESDVSAAQVDLDFELAMGAVERERDEYLDALRRLQADFENYKKRTLRQHAEQVDRAGETLVEQLLPVLDAVDLARQHGAGDDPAIDKIASALTEALSKAGLERIDPVAEPFDPTEHEAVAHEPANEDDLDGKQIVSSLMRAGYRWKGRLLRPAMVSVRG
jgi:molecular chaperone GrpE